MNKKNTVGGLWNSQLSFYRVVVVVVKYHYQVQTNLLLLIKFCVLFVLHFKLFYKKFRMHSAASVFSKCKEIIIKIL